MPHNKGRDDPAPPILWLGGSPCSGKSSIAQALSQRLDLTAYHCDDHWEAHVAQADVAREPHLARIAHLSWDEIWMRPVATLLADELAIYREEFPMILRDLAEHQQPSVRLLTEGAALLPECVAPLIADIRQALWMVPTEAFQRRVYPQRGPWVQEILAQCADPQAAFANWMDRDIAFARHMAAQADALGLRVLWVDGETSLAENTRTVRDWFAPYLRPADSR